MQTPSRCCEPNSRWVNNAQFQLLAQDNFLLNELKPLSKDLSALAAAGLRMLDYLQAGQSAPKSWLAEQNARVTQLQKPSAEVAMAAVRPVKILLDHLATR